VNTPVSSIIWVFTAGFVGSFGAVLLKSGAARLDFKIRALLTNWRLAAGIAVYLLSFVFFVQGMRHGELSVLYPLVALGYLWTVLWAKLFFGEPLTWGKFFGLGMILLGISVLFLGNK
jgi:undecaprenyl phosphate-alpha-L-ara4N flippase subunit ArnE